MWNYIFKKLLLSFVFLVLMLFAVYLLQAQFKGDPFKALLNNSTDPAGARDAYIATLKENDLLGANGLIKDPIVRLGDWINNLFADGSLGRIYAMHSDYGSVSQTIFTPLRTSMLVAIPAYVLGTIFGLALGILSGYKRGKWTDQFINIFVSVFISIPSFVLAAFAIIIGPRIGLPTMFENSVGLDYTIRTLVLPIIVITLISLSGWTFKLRAEIGSILASDYILAARTKGYGEWFIFKRYVLRNAMYPFAGALATGFMAAFASSIIVEKFFNIPGSTSLIVSAAQNGELNISIANSLIFGLIGLGTSIIADVAQFSINPLVKAGFANSTSIYQKFKSAYIRRQQPREVAIEVIND